MTASLDLQRSDDLETRLLIQCARASIEPERAERIRELAAGDLDWTRVLTLADRNGLAPLLYWHLSRTCAAIVPAAPFDRLRDSFQRNSAFNLLLTGELLRLLTVLRRSGVEAVPFKGPALAERLFGNVALRHFCDLDILVRERDVWRAAQVIETRGFEPGFRVPAGRRTAFLRDGYVKLFRRDAGRLLVELHWNIAPRSFAVRFDADAVWSHLEPMTLHGQTVFMPTTEDLILMLCVHGSRHRWDKLEGLCGVAELVRSKPDFDWAYVWRKAEEMHCRRMLAFALHLAQRLLDLPLPREVEAQIDVRAFSGMTRRVVRRFSIEALRPQRRVRHVAFDVRLKDGYADRARHCAGLLFTVEPDDWDAVRLPGPFSFGYPLVHVVRVARKHALSRLQTGRCP